jgi:hypothetical protein
MSGPELTRELLMGQLLEAYRGREVRTHELRGSMTLSQADVVPADAWLDDCRGQVETLSNKDVPQLLAAAPESDLLDVLKALQCAWPSKTTTGSARWVALAKVLIADPEATAGRKGRQLLEFVVNQVPCPTSFSPPPPPFQTQSQMRTNAAFVLLHVRRKGDRVSR